MAVVVSWILLLALVAAGSLLTLVPIFVCWRRVRREKRDDHLLHEVLLRSSDKTFSTKLAAVHNAFVANMRPRNPPAAKKT
ncbi:hypothetical protein QR680_013159 [Steinernema hermaphroditum]|uniref:Uncharacterized protein n=1 Tax=Steinernema hermaphroditum TaxID=289476 RepID=A0AA39I655_9BILA|nr:hypothetical protein QR680_013159 [Steinernema hermaphroditum]